MKKKRNKNLEDYLYIKKNGNKKIIFNILILNQKLNLNVLY